MARALWALLLCLASATSRPASAGQALLGGAEGASCAADACEEDGVSHLALRAAKLRPPSAIMPHPLACGDGVLEPLRPSECPRRVYHLETCDKVSVGDLCEGDGECSTNTSLNNCNVFDVYRMKPSQLFCPLDVQTCPDGSSVGRDPLNGCEFFECPDAPVFCPTDMKTCPDGTLVGRDPSTCRFRACPAGVVCPTDMKTCPDGTLVGRDPSTCRFHACPAGVVCPTDMKTCPDGTLVGRDPSNCRFRACPGGGMSIR